MLLGGCHFSNPAFDDPERGVVSGAEESDPSGGNSSKPFVTEATDTHSSLNDSKGESDSTVSTSANAETRTHETPTVTSETSNISTVSEFSSGTSAAAPRGYCDKSSHSCHLMKIESDDSITNQNAQNPSLTGGNTLMQVTNANAPDWMEHSAKFGRDSWVYHGTPYSLPDPKKFGFDALIKSMSCLSEMCVVLGLPTVLALLRNPDNTVFCAFDKSGTVDQTAGFKHPTDDEFHHYACRFDGTDLELWIDGQVEARKTVGPKDFSQQRAVFAIGGPSDNGDANQVFSGEVAATRLWFNVEAMKAALNEEG